jgi:hypothetical protein
VKSPLRGRIPARRDIVISFGAPKLIRALDYGAEVRTDRSPRRQGRPPRNRPRDDRRPGQAPRAPVAASRNPTSERGPLRL